MDMSVVDDLIKRLTGAKEGKAVQLAESEIRLLLLTVKEIFMSQPNLLELEAPIKICGRVLQAHGDPSQQHAAPNTPGCS